MNYSELKPDFKLGDSVYVMHQDMQCKFTVIGMRLFPFPNPHLPPFRFLLFTPNENEQFWHEPEGMFLTLDELIAYTTDGVSDETCSYDELADHNETWATSKKQPLKLIVNINN